MRRWSRESCSHPGVRGARAGRARGLRAWAERNGEFPGADGRRGGFLEGLWNGVIAPVTFIISLFTRNVQMYEVHNNGGWYNFGFLLGMAVIFGGGGGGAASRRSRRDSR